MEMRPKPPATCASFGCMKATCLIFSVINAVTCILAFLSSVALLLFGLYVWLWNLYQETSFTSSKKSDSEGWAYLLYFLTIIGFLCTSITGLALYFAILLCIGIQKDNKYYIKLYLRFGIAVVAFSMALTLLSLWLTYKNEDKLAEVLIAFVVIIVYTGFLELLRKTYFTSGQSQEAIGRLINQSNLPECYGAN